MRKLLFTFTASIILLSACSNQPEQYIKVKGEVVDKFTSPSRFGTNYHVNVSYPFGENNKYSIDDCYVSKEVYENIKIKDEVIIYVNENGIGEIVK